MPGPNSREIKEMRDECEKLYLAGEHDAKVFKAKTGMSIATMYRWLNAWDEKHADEQETDKKIILNIKKALNKGLEAFADDPHNKGLQSLVSLLKQHLQIQEPSKELNKYILKFLDQTVGYFISIGNERMREAFQEHVVDLGDFLRRKNNG